MNRIQCDRSIYVFSVFLSVSFTIKSTSNIDQACLYTIMIYLPMTSDIAPWTLTCSKKFSRAGTSTIPTLTNIFTVCSRTGLYFKYLFRDTEKNKRTPKTHADAVFRVAFQKKIIDRQKWNSQLIYVYLMYVIILQCLRWFVVGYNLSLCFICCERTVSPIIRITYKYVFLVVAFRFCELFQFRRQTHFYFDWFSWRFLLYSL